MSDNTEILHVMDNKREHSRTDVEIAININWPGRSKEITTSSNYSEGGILSRNPFKELPPIDTQMTLQVATLVNGKEAPVFCAIVIRSTEAEIAFKFVSN